MQSNNKVIILLTLLILSLNSCKQQETGQVDNVIVELPDDFGDFYTQFHNDSVFQINHIIFPLAGKIGESENETNWSRENWVIHKPFDSTMANYKLDYTVMNDIVIEKILDSYAAFYMERRFAKITGEWNLIYYREEYNDPGLKMDSVQ